MFFLNIWFGVLASGSSIHSKIRVNNHAAHAAKGSFNFFIFRKTSNNAVKWWTNGVTQDQLDSAMV